MITSSKSVMITLLLALGCQIWVVCSQTDEGFPCGNFTSCSMKKQQYCNERDKRCESCEREMQHCGTPQMKDMRPTCKIYCYQDLKDREQEEQFQNQIQIINDTWDGRLKDMQKQKENLQQDNQALLAKIERLEGDLAVQRQIVVGLSVTVGVGVIAVMILSVIIVKKICGSGKSGEVLIDPAEEEALNVVTTTEVDTKLSAGVEEPENDEASSGMGSAESSLAGSKEKLENNRERQPLLGAGLDEDSSAPQAASGGSGPRKAPSAPAAPGSMETPVKGGRNRPNNGQAFPDLARGDTSGGEEEAPISLAGNRAPFSASTATPAEAIATPCCPTCQQALSCQFCSRAQVLSDQSGSMQPSSAHPNNPNCPLAEDMHRTLNSIRDTAPDSSAFTPNPSNIVIPTSSTPQRV